MVEFVVEARTRRRVEVAAAVAAVGAIAKIAEVVAEDVTELHWSASTIVGAAVAEHDSALAAWPPNEYSPSTQHTAAMHQVLIVAHHHRMAWSSCYRYAEGQRHMPLGTLSLAVGVSSC